MAVTLDMIKEIREKTGSGMMDCKKALTEADGDMEKAIKWLREKGIATAEKKSSRIAAEGIVESYISYLRRKLDPEDRIKPIETLRGRGYRFTLR